MTRGMRFVGVLPLVLFLLGSVFVTLLVNNCIALKVDSLSQQLHRIIQDRPVGGFGAFERGGAINRCHLCRSRCYQFLSKDSCDKICQSAVCHESSTEGSRYEDGITLSDDSAILDDMSEEEEEFLVEELSDQIFQMLQLVRTNRGIDSFVMPRTLLQFPRKRLDTEIFRRGDRRDPFISPPNWNHLRKEQNVFISRKNQEDGKIRSECDICKDECKTKDDKPVCFAKCAAKSCRLEDNNIPSTMNE